MIGEENEWKHSTARVESSEVKKIFEAFLTKEKSEKEQ
jgi:hypothetical protein